MRQDKPMTGHATINRKKNLEMIDNENARLYQKLRNRSCHVQRAGDLINQFK